MRVTFYSAGTTPDARQANPPLLRPCTIPGPTPRATGKGTERGQRPSSILQLGPSVCGDLMSSFGENELLVISRIVGRIRVLDLSPGSAVFPRLIVRLGVALHDDP